MPGSRPSRPGARPRDARERRGADNAMNYQGNPPGLVDARFVDALRAAYFKKRKGLV